MSTMVDCYFPSKLTKIRYSDKPWMTPSLKFAIKKRQIAFRKHGKSSQAYKFWRDKVQREVRAARAKYYSCSVAKLKDTNPSRWWKEIKSLGGLSSQDCWHQQLFQKKTLLVWSLRSPIITFLLVSLRIFNLWTTVRQASQ